MNKVVIIQARTNATRLPNKVLLKINKRTMLEHVVQRLKKSKLVDLIVIATTVSKRDEEIVKLAKSINVPVYRGSEDDVLDRYYRTAKKFQADIVIRVTADCPLICPLIVDKVISRYLSRRPDYALSLSRENNSLSYPRGMNVEVLSFNTLTEIWERAKTARQREHVTLYLEENSDNYTIEWIEAEENLRRPFYRLTVDTPEDLRLIRRIYSSFDDEDFITLKKVIELLDNNPEYFRINLGVIQKKDSEILHHKEYQNCVVFRVNGGFEQGIGNVKRCISLARELEKLGYEPQFITNSNPVVEDIIEKHFKYESIPDFSCRNDKMLYLREVMGNILPLFTIVDLPFTDFHEMFLSREFSGFLVDINGEHHNDLFADIIVRDDIGITVDKNPFSSYLLGSDYKILGGDVKGLRKKNKTIHDMVKRIVVTMGGTDPNHLTMKVIRSLQDVSYEVQVIIGPGFLCRDELIDEIEKKPNFSFVENPDNVPAILVTADICFIAGGLTLYESACIGVPSIVLCQNESQLVDALMLQKQGACICLGLGSNVSHKEISDSIQENSAFSIRINMHERGMSLVDGLGAKRVAQKLREQVKKTRGKRVLVIGAGIEQIPLIKAAQSIGCNTIVVDRNPNSPGFRFSHHVYSIDTRDIENIHKIAVKHNIDGVLTNTETGVRTASSIATRMGCLSISEHTSSVITNKAKMKEHLLKNNIPTPSFFVITNLREARRAAEKLGFPVIVKPCDKAAARGVMVANDFFDIEKAYQFAIDETNLSYILIEKFFEGDELGCETFSYNKKLHLIVLTSKIRSNPPYRVVMGHTIPVVLSESEQKKILSIIKEALHVFDIEQGPVNFDILLTEKGPQIIDMGVRLGGNHLPLLTFLSTGVNTYKEAVKTALKIKPDLNKRFSNASSVRFLTAKPGILKNILGIDSVKHIDGLVSIDFYVQNGDRIEEVINVNNRIGNYVVVANDFDSLAKRVTEVEKKLQIVTETI